MGRKFQFICNEIRFLCSQLEVVFHHMVREPNEVADGITLQGIDRNNSFVGLCCSLVICFLLFLFSCFCQYKVVKIKTGQSKKAHKLDRRTQGFKWFGYVTASVGEM